MSEGYTVKTTGRPALKIIELLCESCQYAEDHTIDMRQTEEEIARDMIVRCPSCEEADMVRVWRTAPAVGGGDPRSDANLAKMQRSLKERFIKKDVDDVRHKHGVNFDDSIRSGAVNRIKKGQDPA